MTFEYGSPAPGSLLSSALQSKAVFSVYLVGERVPRSVPLQCLRCVWPIVSDNVTRVPVYTTSYQVRNFYSLSLTKNKIFFLQKMFGGFIAKKFWCPRKI